VVVMLGGCYALPTRVGLVARLPSDSFTARLLPFCVTTRTTPACRVVHVCAARVLLPDYALCAFQFHHRVAAHFTRFVRAVWIHAYVLRYRTLHYRLRYRWMTWFVATRFWLLLRTFITFYYVTLVVLPLLAFTPSRSDSTRILRFPVQFPPPFLPAYNTCLYARLCRVQFPDSNWLHRTRSTPT